MVKIIDVRERDPAEIPLRMKFNDREPVSKDEPGVTVQLVISEAYSVGPLLHAMEMSESE